MELEIINKLFLELSQIATAHTAKELKLREQLKNCANRLETIRETNPDIALDDDISRTREALRDSS